MLPRQYAPRAGTRMAGDTLVRSRESHTGEAVAQAALFLAGSARITGQTLRLS